eukprot:scaffold1872_cov152-Ochromonas_danica.AAC.2
MLWSLGGHPRCCTQICSFDFQSDFAQIINLLCNIGSFLGLTYPSRDVKSIQEEERANHFKDEVADAIKRYGYSR